MKKIENNAAHITKQMSANKNINSNSKKDSIISQGNIPECIYGADNKPATTIFHGF
jgi:hypothetical protein